MTFGTDPEANGRTHAVETPYLRPAGLDPYFETADSDGWSPHRAAPLIPQDTRFRALVEPGDWPRLPLPVRRRFSKSIPAGGAVVYSGRVLETRLSAAGRLLSFLLRPIGAPLPRESGAHGAAIVTVTESSLGQCWTRIYACSRGVPQVITSMKRFRGPTGLEEHVGAGLGMALRVSVVDGALHFRSDHYFLELGRLRIRLPRALSPGEMLIVHREESDGGFTFRLTLTHRLFGCLVHQLAHFSES